MKATLLVFLLAVTVLTGAQSVTNISPDQAYQGQSLQTTITSSGFFLIGSTPQGNIAAIILKNATDSVFAVSDSTKVVNGTTATTFWNIPSNIATGLYTLIVRVYNNLFSGPTTDYSLSNSFNITSTVWPGDADNNHVVDNNDLLPIGLGYDSTGPTRPGASIVWQAQSAVDWSRFFSTYAPLVNYKYADCNGDGVIDAHDTMAILQNFSLTHAKVNGGGAPWRSGAPVIKPVFDKDTSYNGDMLNVSFVLGDTSIPADHIYGVAFTWNFDPLVVDSAFTTFSFGNSWFGTTVDKIAIGKVFNNQGQIKIAQTRIDHVTRSGNGSIGGASFKITTDNISGLVSGPYYNNIGYISNVAIIDSAGNQIPVNAGIDSNKVAIYPNDIHDVYEKMIEIMPNPAKTQIRIRAEDNIKEITITNIRGQEVSHTGNVHATSWGTDISAYDDGLYFVQVKTEKKTKITKLLVAK